MNVIDKYRGWEADLVRKDVEANTLPYAVCMINVEYDFNIGTLIRNANAFGARKVFYVQDRRKWDRRGAVGTHHYTAVQHLKAIEDLHALRDEYQNFVAIEITEDAIPLREYKWKEDTLIIFGSEGNGIPDEILAICDDKVYIPMIGSVRSLNVGTSSGIVLNDAASCLPSSIQSSVVAR